MSPPENSPALAAKPMAGWPQKGEFNRKPAYFGSIQDSMIYFTLLSLALGNKLTMGITKKEALRAIRRTSKETGDCPLMRRLVGLGPCES